MEENLFERTDVRETPKDTEATMTTAESTGAQTLGSEEGWTDVTGCTKTIITEGETTIAVFGNVQGDFPAAIQNHGVGVKILVDAVDKAERAEVKNYSVNLAANNKLNVPIQYCGVLAAGSHTIKLQAYGYEDGAGTKVTLPSGYSSLVIIADKVFR